MLNAKICETRTITYEIMVQHDGRWLIDCLLEQKLEAVARARALLARGAAEAVKVVKRRSRADGQSVTTEVLHETLADPKGPRFALSGTPENLPVCKTLSDLESAAGRRTIGRLLRDYLQHCQITPTELMFCWPHARRLRDDCSLLQAAIHHVASRQADKAGQSAGARVKALDALVDQAIKRAHSLDSERRKWPRLEAGTLRDLEETVRLGVPGEAKRPLFLALLSDRLLLLAGLEHKLEFLLRLLDGAAGPAGEGGIESVIADCLAFPDVLQAVAGAPGTRFARLCLLADVLAGRLSPARRQELPALAALTALIKDGRGEACRRTLEERLAADLAGKAPLDASGAQPEKRLIELLGRRLRQSDGSWIGGEATRRALEARGRRLREQSLRDLGLQSTADSLASGDC